MQSHFPFFEENKNIIDHPITDIRFSFTHKQINFSFKEKDGLTNELKATLHLPSVFEFNGFETNVDYGYENSENSEQLRKEKAIYLQLIHHFYSSFKSKKHATASLLLSGHIFSIVKVPELDPTSNLFSVNSDLYLAFCLNSNEPYLIHSNKKENKITNGVFFDFEEVFITIPTEEYNDIVQKTKQILFQSIHNELNQVINGVDNFSAIDFNLFMSKEFHTDWREFCFNDTIISDFLETLRPDLSISTHDLNSIIKK